MFRGDGEFQCNDDHWSWCDDDDDDDDDHDHDDCKCGATSGLGRTIPNKSQTNMYDVSYVHCMCNKYIITSVAHHFTQLYILISNTLNKAWCPACQNWIQHLGLESLAYIMLISSSRNGQAKQSWAGFCRFLVSLIVLLQNCWNLDGCCMLLLLLSKLSNIKGPFGKSCPLAPLVAVRTSPAMAAMGSN